MAKIEVTGLTHRYPQAESEALKVGEFTWDDGGAYALLGPSGCGKSTLLNILSGLLVPTQGQVFFDGKDVTQLNPRERNIAQVFQFPVIYDTMTVFDNLAFPLRNRGLAKAAIDARVQEVGELLELTPTLQKKAKGLSADQKQLISLGRGLVRKDVAAILFDEPLTVIDPHQKFKLRRKLKAIHQQFELTLIYVTHDQSEALTFADQVAVMSDGAVVQTGTPEQLYENPSHRFVGHFIGNPGMNFIPVNVTDNAIFIDGVNKPEGRLNLSSSSIEKGKLADGEACIGVRPEYLKISELDSGEDTDLADYIASIPVAITAVENHGNYFMLNADLNNQRIMVRSDVVPTSQSVQLHFPRAMTKLYVNNQLLE